MLPRLPLGHIWLDAERPAPRDPGVPTVRGGGVPISNHRGRFIQWPLSHGHRLLPWWLWHRKRLPSTARWFPRPRRPAPATSAPTAAGDWLRRGGLRYPPDARRPTQPALVPPRTPAAALAPSLQPQPVPAPTPLPLGQPWFAPRGPLQQHPDLQHLQHSHQQHHHGGSGGHRDGREQRPGQRQLPRGLFHGLRTTGAGQHVTVALHVHGVLLGHVGVLRGVRGHAERLRERRRRRIRPAHAALAGLPAAHWSLTLDLNHHGNNKNIETHIHIKKKKKEVPEPLIWDE